MPFRHLPTSSTSISIRPIGIYISIIIELALFLTPELSPEQTWDRSSELRRPPRGLSNGFFSVLHYQHVGQSRTTANDEQKRFVLIDSLLRHIKIDITQLCVFDVILDESPILLCYALCKDLLNEE